MSYKKVFFSFFVFICIGLPFLNAQVNIDSLTTLLQKTEGNPKVDLLNTLCFKLAYSNSDEAIAFGNESIALAKDIKYQKGEAIARYYLALVLKITGDYATALEVCEEAIVNFKQIRDSYGIARIRNLKGNIFSDVGKYTDALANYKEAKTVSDLSENVSFSREIQSNMANLTLIKGEYRKAIEEYQIVCDAYLEEADSFKYYIFYSSIGKAQHRLGNFSEALSIFFEVESYEASIDRKQQLGINYNNIGLLYLDLDMDDQAILMLEKALQIFVEGGSKRGIGLMYEHIGDYFSKINEIEKADSLYHLSLLVYDSIGLKNTGVVYNNIAELRIKTQEYEEAKALLEKALNINKSLGELDNIAWNYTNLGTVHRDLKQFKKSEKHFLLALEIWNKIKDVKGKHSTATSLVEIYKQTGETQKIEHYSEVAKLAKDSLFNKEKLLKVNKIIVTELLTKHEKNTKALSTELSTAQQKIAASENKSNSLSSKINLLFILLFIGLSVGMIWYFKKRKVSPVKSEIVNLDFEEEAKQLRTTLENKNKELAILSMETAQKNDFFIKLHSTLQNLIRKHPDNLEIKKLGKFFNSNHVEQDKWKIFNSYFNEINSGFFDRFSEAYPSMTKNDLRLCSLIRLKIPSYEASIILGISLESIHKARYRIRKKMDLKSGEDLEKTIETV